jgi:hypothetical protein
MVDGGWLVVAMYMAQPDRGAWIQAIGKYATVIEKPPPELLTDSPDKCAIC